LILCNEFKFIFIKGKRVGGTSVEMALSTICGSRDVITPIAPIDELARMKLGARAQNYAAVPQREKAYIECIQTAPSHALAQITVPQERYYNHMSLREVFTIHGPSASSFDVVCVERSPFAKILSWANWLASAEAYLAGGKLQTDLKALRRSVERIFDSGEFAEVRNIDLYRGEDGRVAARVLRYENLAAELQIFLSSRGVTKLPQLPKAKAGLMSDRLEPREFFSKSQLLRINQLFADEFDTFSYSRLL
jgi:hypothetical protein